MYKLLFIGIVIVTVNLQGFGQKTLQELSLIPNSEQKVDTILEISWNYLINNFQSEKSKPYLDAGLKIAKKLDYQLGVAEYYMYLRLIVQYTQEDLAPAENYFKQAYNIRLNEYAPIEAASACNNLLNLYSYQGKLSEAKDIGLTGLKLLQTNKQTSKNLDLQSKIHNALGEVYRELGEYTKSLKHLEKGLNIRKDLGIEYQVGLMQLFISLGSLHSEDDIKNYFKAIEYYEKGLALAQTNEDIIHEGKLLINIGGVYLAQQKLDKALKYLKQARTLNDDLIYDDQLRLSKEIGDVFFELKQSKVALNEWIPLEAAYIELEDSFELCHLLTDMGWAYHEINNNDQALAYLQRANDIANDLDNQKLQIETLESLGSFYIKQENFQLAIEVLDMAAAIQDSLTLLAQEAMNYQANYEQKQKENAELENETLKLERVNLIWTGLGIIATLALLVGLFAFYAYRNKKTKELAWRETDSLIREQELKLAYARIEGRNEERERVARDLHDGLGGLLSSVKLQLGIMERKLGEFGKGVFEQFNTVSSLLDESSDEVRCISHNMMSNSLEKFGLKFIIEHLAEEIRDSKQIVINVSTHDMDERLDKFLEVKLYRIIQELIRNILKHAKAEKIDIELNRFDNIINFTIEDNGVGFDLDMVKAKRKGIGIQNIEKRVKELEGTLNIDSSIGRGTTVFIDIPIKENY